MKKYLDKYPVGVYSVNVQDTPAGYFCSRDDEFGKSGKLQSHQQDITLHGPENGKENMERIETTWVEIIQ